MLKLKKLKKYVALGLSCLIAINTTTVTFAQNSTSNQEYESANNEVSNSVIIKNSGVIINGTYYSIAEFESLLDHAILISETSNSSARIAAIGAGIYFIPGIGEVVIAATGAIAVAGVTITVGTWLYKTITNWLSNSSKREIAKIRASIPKRLRKKNGDVNLGKFKNKVKGKTSYKEEGGWAIDKDTAGHGGRKWKLKNKKGNRIASLGTQINNTVNNLVSTGEQIWSFYAKKADMELQPNLSAGNYNANNILQMNQKLNFSVMFQRVCLEQFKQIDNYFDKFGYAINDFKAVNYNNRSNFDYIETSQVVIEGDVPEDDMNTIKNIFNSGVRIWHDTSTFLNYSAYEYNTSDKK